MKKTTKAYASVHDLKFKAILELVNGNKNKAHFLDKIIIWHRNSKYTLPRTKRDKSQVSDEGRAVWFTRTWEDINLEINCDENKGKSTLKNYMKEFCEQGYVERSQKKPGRNVRVYFRATEKLYRVLKINGFFENDVDSCNSLPNQPLPCDRDNLEAEVERLVSEKVNTLLKTNENTKHLPKAQISEDLKPRSSIYKDPNIKINTIISRKVKPCGKLFNLPSKVKALFEKIGTDLSEKQKSILWGSVYNVYQKHKNFTPHEVTAWIAFQLIHKSHHLTNVEDFQKKINIFMALLRKGELRRPRGFYNHWGVGAEMAVEQSRARKQAQRDKFNFDNVSVRPVKRYCAYKTPDGDDVLYEDQKNHVIEKKLSSIKMEIRDISTLRNENVSHLRYLKQIVSSSTQQHEVYISSNLQSKHELDIKKLSAELKERELQNAQYTQAINELNQKLKLEQQEYDRLLQITSPLYQEVI